MIINFFLHYFQKFYLSSTIIKYSKIHLKNNEMLIPRNKCYHHIIFISCTQQNFVPPELVYVQSC